MVVTRPQLSVDKVNLCHLRLKSICATCGRSLCYLCQMIERRDTDGIRVLKLAHGKVSAMDIELGEALTAELNAANDASVKAVIVTGTGSAFSAGVDLFRVLKDGPEYGRRFLPVLDQFLRATLTFPKPVVAAINGHAIAGGCILAAACDHRIMTEGNGFIGIPELAVGVPFPALPLQIMAARLADGPLRDLVYTGRTVQIDEAKAIGLIDEKCPEGMLLDRAMEVAQKLSSIPAGAFAMTKEAFYTPILERTRQLADLNARVVEAWLQQHTYDTIRAYLENTVGKK
jgi:enoyl-CoA hydratase